MRALRRLARRNMDWIENFPLYSTNASPQTALDSLERLDGVLGMNKRLLGRSEQVANALLERVQQASADASPFSSTTLSDALRETQVKVSEALRSVRYLAVKGSTRLDEIINDVKRQATNVRKRRGTYLAAVAVVEALDETIEARPDASAQLEEVRKTADEAASTVDFNLNRVDEILATLANK